MKKSYFLFIGFMTFLFLSTIHAQNIEDYVGRWTFDNENSDYTMIGDPQILEKYVPVPGTNGISLDGEDDRIDLGDAENLAAESLSVALWVRRTAEHNTNDNVFWGGVSDIRWTFTNSVAQLWLSDEISNEQFIGGNLPPIDEWVHLVLTVDENDIKVYYNGEEIGSYGSGTTITPNTETKALGNGTGNIFEDRALAADFCDVRIYDRSLNADEVAALYDLGEEVVYEKFEITVIADPEHGGTVSGGGVFEETTEITVEAYPEEAWKFVGWYLEDDKISSDPEYSFIVDGDKTLVAKFEEMENPVTVELNAVPEEGGTVYGAGVYEQGDDVTVTADANYPYQLEHWLVDDDIVSSESVYTFTVEDDITLVAKFSQLDRDRGNITFLVGGDSHYESGEDHENRLATQTTIEDMNSLPGEDYPSPIGGTVDMPLFLATTGDMMEYDSPESITYFEEDFGLKGEGLLDYPVYEGWGNHDIWAGQDTVVKWMAERTKERDVLKVSDNGYHYGWEEGGVHFLQLNKYPGNEGDEDNHGGLDNNPYYSLQFMEEYLEKHVGLSDQPVVIFQHYGFTDWCMNAWGAGGWWSDEERDVFYDAIKDYNVLGIFWGHSHAINIMEWRGIDVYNVGAMQRGDGGGDYMVVNITDSEMSVAVRNNDGTWGVTDTKTIERPDPLGISFFASSDLHYGLQREGAEPAYVYNDKLIEAMNAMPGNNYPDEIGGIVHEPRGVIITGDLTEHDRPSEIEDFTSNWGLNGEEELNYPVFETFGNHDGDNVRQEIIDRNPLREHEITISDNGLHYAFNWNYVRFIAAGIFPGYEESDGLFNYDPYESLDFIVEDLETNVGATGEPVVIYHHFGFGGHSYPTWWTEDEAEEYYNAIKDYNVIAIISGHEHDHSFEQWEGIDVINLPHYDDNIMGENGFAVINITGNKLNAAFYSTKEDDWFGDVLQKEIGLGSIFWNIPPSVSIIKPDIEPGEIKYIPEIPESITLTAEAEDEDGEVVSVEFFVDDNSIGLLESEPYSIDWSPEQSGYFDLYAIAIDDEASDTKSETITIAIGEDINLAPLASELSTSHVSPWEDLYAINNRIDPESSTDKTGGAYGNWNQAAQNSWHWVQYDFPWEITLEQSEVYWWTDGGGIQIPYNAYLEYWNEEEQDWVEVPDPEVNGVVIPNDEYGLDRDATTENPAPGCEADMYNVTAPSEEITTTSVRLHSISHESTGILEWKIYRKTDTETDYELEVIINPDVSGTVSFNPEQDYYNMDDEITLTATPEEGYEFVNWTDEDGDELSNEAEFNFTMPDNNVTLTVNFEEGVFIEELSKEDINVYPNPAQDKLIVESNETIKSIKLIDIRGNIIKNKFADELKYELNVHQLNSGVYFLQIHTINGVVTKLVQITQ